MDLAYLQKKYGSHTPTLLDAAGQYAVLVPLVDTPNGLSLLYEVRAAGIRQEREVCFPGGRMEPGETVEECALRETQEELGIARDHIRIIAPLDFLHLRTDALLFPVLAAVDSAGIAKMAPSPSEVSDTFFVTVKWLQAHPPTVYRYPLRPMVDEDFPYMEVRTPPAYVWTEGEMVVPVYHGLPYPLWGMSARITAHLCRDFTENDT